VTFDRDNFRERKDAIQVKGSQSVKPLKFTMRVVKVEPNSISTVGKKGGRGVAKGGGRVMNKEDESLDYKVVRAGHDDGGKGCGGREGVGRYMSDGD